jgi:curved DNA-binding protein CbpA
MKSKLKTLFDKLKITPTEDETKIKKAFRDQSKKNHPDVGGDPEVFHEICEAYQILIDPEKQENFINHGSADGPRQPSAVQMAITVFSQIMQHGINDYTSIKEAVIKYKDAAKQESESKLNKMEKDKKNFEKLLSRIKKKPENDFLGKYFIDNIESIEKAVIAENNHFELFAAGCDLILDYEFSVKEREEEESTYNPFGSFEFSTSGGGW